MRRKHAFVIALSFVLVGMMFFSVDTPMIVDQQESSQDIATPQEVTQIVAEVDSSGNLRTNVIENPSFEYWTSGNPDGYDSVHESGYTDVDFAYQGSGVTDLYAALIEAHGSPTDTTEGSISQTLLQVDDALVEPGISLSFDWNTLANPDIDQNSGVEVQIVMYNGLGAFQSIFYVLSHGSYSPTNITQYGYFMMNESLNQWNPFDVNITEDFMDVFGAGALTSTHYIGGIIFRAWSILGATDMLQVAFDNIVLTNYTYSGWIGNGDFETGVRGPWSEVVSDPAYVEQSTDSTEGSYSLNMSIPEVASGSGYAYINERFDYPGGVLASSLGDTVLEFDWKYNDTPSAGSVQYCYLYMQFRNEIAHHDMYLWFGTHNDAVPLSNQTYSKSLKVPGFGFRNTWQHTSLDIKEYMNSVGYSDMSLYEIRLAMESTAIGSSLELLVDDFRLVTYPLGDPGFEVDWFLNSATPFAGWKRWSGEVGVISATTDALAGSYACNLTVTGVDYASVYRDDYILLHPSDLTNFSWRLDEMGGGNEHVDIEIRFSDTNTLNYILGHGDSYSPTNSSDYKYIVADSFNTIGVWNQFVVNLTADAEEAFGSSSGLTIDRIIIESASPTGDRVSCLFDEMHFIDAGAPIVNSVDFTPATPMYYDTVDVTVYAHDARSGIQSVFVDYYNGSWWGLPATDMGGYYVATIPAHSYGITVEFQVSVTDLSGLTTLDNNGGSRYTYTVGDDVDPTLTIDNPVNNTEQEGLLAITATVDDPGSGVEYVTFNTDGVGPIDDYTDPYSQNWNLDDESLGSHFIIVTVHDNAGNTVSKTHYFTVVDTENPVLDTPADVEFTVGESGHSIDWGPSDNRPGSYEVLVDTISTYTGLWNSSSEHRVIDLDGLSVGTYNYTCVVYDDAGNSYADTVIVTVSEASTTTPTPTETTEPTTTPEPTGGDPLGLILIVAGGAGVVVVILIIVMMKKKET